MLGGRSLKSPTRLNSVVLCEPRPGERRLTATTALALSHSQKRHPNGSIYEESLANPGHAWM